LQSSNFHTKKIEIFSVAANNSILLSVMSSDPYIVQGLAFALKPLNVLQFPELVLAYRAAYLEHYSKGFLTEWNLFVARLHQYVNPVILPFIEHNGNQLVYEPPNSVMWYILLHNQKVIQACMDAAAYAAMSDEDLLKVLREYCGPPIVREAMMSHVDRDRLAALQQKIWWEREQPDFLAWLEGLD